MFEVNNTKIEPSYKVFFDGLTYFGSKDELEEKGVPQGTILSHIKSESFLTVKSQHAAALEALTGSTTAVERDTWPEKVPFARLYLAGDADPGDIESANLALLESETLESYCQVLLVRRAAFFKMAMFAEGFKRRTNKAIDEVESVERLETVLTESAVAMNTAIAEFQAALTG